MAQIPSEKVQRLDAIYKILQEEDEYNPDNALRMSYARDFKNQNLISKDGDLFLIVDSLIKINNIITGSHNFGLRTCNVKPAGFNKQYMNVNKIEAELYRLIDRFNERKITPRQFVIISLIIFILLQTEPVEHAKFYSMIKLKIFTKFTCKNYVILTDFSFRTQLTLIKMKMNNFSALNARVSADERQH